MAYFFGLIFYIVCKLVYDTKGFKNLDLETSGINKNTNSGKKILSVDGINTQMFIHYYSLDDPEKPTSNGRLCLIMVYFAFTSLSTVGFGDYTPRSDEERLVIAAMLLSGVAIFSYIMGNFISIIKKWKELYEDFDQADELLKFFSLLERFNNDTPINIETR